MLFAVCCVYLDQITFNMLKGLFKTFIYANNKFLGCCVHSPKHREINNFSRGCHAFYWIMVYNVWKNIVFMKINDFKVFKSEQTNTDSIEAIFPFSSLERLFLAWALGQFSQQELISKDLFARYYHAPQPSHLLL